MNTRRGALNPRSQKENNAATSTEDERREAPTIKHELALTKLLLEAEKERARLREETIAILKSDKGYLQQELARKDELIQGLLKTGIRSMDPPSSSGESSKSRSPPKRINISDDDSEAAFTVPVDSSLSDSSLEDDSKNKKKYKKRAILLSSQLPPKFSGGPRPETSRIRVKNCRDIIWRYKAALQAYREGKSMKAAFEGIGVDRNTISRTAVIAELSLAAPDVLKAIGSWNEKVEKLSTFVDRCRAAMTTEIKERISEMKEKGHLLPILY